MENTELRAYYDKFDEFPYLPMMASYDDDTYQYLLTMAILRGTPLTQEEIEKEYHNKVDLVEEQENEGKGMDKNGETKIRKLLQEYGASPEEIENFMTDLYETKDDIKDDMEDNIEEDDDFNYLDGDTMAKLKATEEGQNLIINAPKMAKDELKKAITEYLSKQS